MKRPVDPPQNPLHQRPVRPGQFHDRLFVGQQLLLHKLCHDLLVCLDIILQRLVVPLIALPQLLPSLGDVNAFLLQLFHDDGFQLSIALCHLHAVRQLVGDNLRHRVLAPAVDVDRSRIRIIVPVHGSCRSRFLPEELHIAPQGLRNSFRAFDVCFPCPGHNAAAPRGICFFRRPGLHFNLIRRRQKNSLCLLYLGAFLLPGRLLLGLLHGGLIRLLLSQLDGPIEVSQLHLCDLLPGFLLLADFVGQLSDLAPLFEFESRFNNGVLQLLLPQLPPIVRQFRRAGIGQLIEPRLQRSHQSRYDSALESSLQNFSPVWIVCIFRRFPENAVSCISHQPQNTIVYPRLYAVGVCNRNPLLQGFLRKLSGHVQSVLPQGLQELFPGRLRRLLRAFLGQVFHAALGNGGNQFPASQRQKVDPCVCHFDQRRYHGLVSGRLPGHLFGGSQVQQCLERRAAHGLIAVQAAGRRDARLYARRCSKHRHRRTGRRAADGAHRSILHLVPELRKVVGQAL